MTEDQYMNYWRGRAIGAEMQVVKLRNKLMFWRAAGISFGIVIIIITIIA